MLANASGVDHVALMRKVAFIKAFASVVLSVGFRKEIKRMLHMTELYVISSFHFSLPQSNASGFCLLVVRRDFSVGSSGQT